MFRKRHFFTLLSIVFLAINLITPCLTLADAKDNPTDAIQIANTEKIEANIIVLKQEPKSSVKEKSVSAQAIVPFPGVFACTAGFNVSRTSICGYGKTQLYSFPGVDVKMNIKGIFWKNGHVYSRIPSTTNYNTTYIYAKSPSDYHPRKGDNYEINTFHLAWDDAGNLVLDHSTEDDYSYN